MAKHCVNIKYTALVEKLHCSKFHFVQVGFPSAMGQTGQGLAAELLRALRALQSKLQKTVILKQTNRISQEGGKKKVLKNRLSGTDCPVLQSLQGLRGSTVCANPALREGRDAEGGPGCRGPCAGLCFCAAAASGDGRPVKTQRQERCPRRQGTEREWRSLPPLPAGPGHTARPAAPTVKNRAPLLPASPRRCRARRGGVGALALRFRSGGGCWGLNRLSVSTGWWRGCLR